MNLCIVCLIDYLNISHSNDVSLNALLIYGVYSFGEVGINELYPLWAYTQPHYGKVHTRLWNIFQFNPDNKQPPLVSHSNLLVVIKFCNNFG